MGFCVSHCSFRPAASVYIYIYVWVYIHSVYVYILQIQSGLGISGSSRNHIPYSSQCFNIKMLSLQCCVHRSIRNSYYEISWFHGRHNYLIFIIGITVSGKIVFLLKWSSYCFIRDQPVLSCWTHIIIIGPTTTCL